MQIKAGLAVERSLQLEYPVKKRWISVENITEYIALQNKKSTK